MSDEAVYIEDERNDFRGIELIKQLISILDPRHVEKSKVNWTPLNVRITSVDEVIRNVYKSFTIKIQKVDDAAVKQELFNMLEEVKLIWKKFRDLYHGRN